MIGWGIMFIIIGIGSFFMQSTGRQFVLVQVFGEGNEHIAGIVFIGIGGLLLFASLVKRSKGGGPQK